MTEPQEIVQGRAPTPEEAMYLDWALEGPKRNFTVVNDMLGKLMTLTPALAGGATLLSDAVIAPFFRPLIVITFLAALGCALAGLFPREEAVPDHVEAIKSHKKRLLDSKVYWLTACVVCLFLGFAAFLGGVAGRMVDPQAPAQEQRRP